MRDFVLSQGQAETSAGNAVTLRLVLTQGTRTVYQEEDGEERERYEGVYELQTLDAQGQLLDREELRNEQGGEVMRFCYRDFPWYFEDYNLDGQQDFFLGTESADWPEAHTERILIDLGEGCDLGSVVYTLDDHTILVYELGSGGAFWTAVRTETQE